MLPAQAIRFASRGRCAVESALPATIRLGVDSARNLDASTGGLKRRRVLDKDGGGLVDIDIISFRVGKALLPHRPADGVQVVWVEQNVTVRLDSVSDGGMADASWTLHCVGVAGGG